MGGKSRQGKINDPFLRTDHRYVSSLSAARTEGDCRTSKTLTGWAEKAGKGKSMTRSFAQIIGMFHRITTALDPGGPQKGNLH